MSTETTHRLTALQIDQIPLADRPQVVKNLVASWGMEGITFDDWHLGLLDQWTRGEIGYAQVDELTDRRIAELRRH